MLIGRFIGGIILGAALSSIVIYTSEISNDEYVELSIIIYSQYSSNSSNFFLFLIVYEDDLARSVHLVGIRECCFVFVLVHI